MDSKPAELSDSSAFVSYDGESEPQTAASSAFEEKIALAPTRQWTTRRAKPRLLGLLPMAVVLTITLGLVTLILGALLCYQCEELQHGRGIPAAIRKGSFFAAEGHSQPSDPESRLWVLTISSLAVGRELRRRLSSHSLKTGCRVTSYRRQARS